MVDRHNGSWKRHQFNPFTPNEPVPPELFAGRMGHIQNVMRRGVEQVAQGRCAYFYVAGDYGIGKTSFAKYLQARASGESSRLHPIYMSLGAARSIEDFSKILMESTIDSGAFDPTRGEKVRQFLAQHVGKQGALGFSIDTTVLRAVYPEIDSHVGTLRFLRETYRRFEQKSTKGIFLVLDEIDKIANDETFANFIKGLIEQNSGNSRQLPLLIIACGLESSRGKLIKGHPSTARLFEVVSLSGIETRAVKQFFRRAFQTKRVGAHEEALAQMEKYTNRHPRIMQLIGYEAWDLLEQPTVTLDVARSAILNASDHVGTQFVRHQILGGLQSPEYRTMIAKVCSLDFATETFTKREVAHLLSDAEIRKFSGFVRRMKEIGFLSDGEFRGQYRFHDHMMRLYFYVEIEKSRRLGQQS